MTSNSSSDSSPDSPLWRPSENARSATNLARFMEDVEDTWNVTMGDQELAEFSVKEPEKFWESVRTFANLSADEWGERVIENPAAMPGAKFYPDAKLNFAENLLVRRDDDDALVFWGEDQIKTRLSAAELYDRVSQTVQALREVGIEPGDRVVGVLHNGPEAIIAMLATSALGAVWSSCSPDFGGQGILDRFGQIEPKALFCVDGYFYGGKTHGCMDKMAQVVAQLPSLKKAIVVAYAGDAVGSESIENSVGFDEFLKPYTPNEIDFARLPFNHPLYIMFSSGTTGTPKCIVHGAGGTLLQHVKEHLLHCDVKPGDRVFYFTTCGWMMWNWMVSGLAAQATLLLYDGSPFFNDGDILFSYLEIERATFFGTSAKFIDALKKADLSPGKNHDLSRLRTIASTGSPLVAEGFDYVYSHIKADVHLASISGGTDIISCFVLGNPRLPVWRGEIQAAGLGMAIEVFDVDGKAISSGKGDLVCTQPFPSMPIGFWNDPDGAKYKATYFEKFAGVWTHGDFIGSTEHGGYIIYGRSDATLNPGGVRIGTAEIYRQVEKLDGIMESIAIGQDWKGDVRVVLFVVLREGQVLDDDLQAKIKSQIRTGATPRHVPAKILAVADIPRTRSGKITELAVRDQVHGNSINNIEALANPEALKHFAGRPELAED